MDAIRAVASSWGIIWTSKRCLAEPLRQLVEVLRDVRNAKLLAKDIQPARLVARVPRETKATVLATPLSLTGAGNPISPQASLRERESPRHFLDPFRTKVSRGLSVCFDYNLTRSGYKADPSGSASHEFVEEGCSSSCDHPVGLPLWLTPMKARGQL